MSWHPVRLSSWAGQAGPGQVAASFALLEIFCLISASNFIFHTIDADHTQMHTLISFQIVSVFLFPFSGDLALNCSSQYIPQ